MVRLKIENNRQKGSWGRSSKSPPRPKVLNKQQIQQKQQNLAASLREAETKQLTSYLKNRSLLLDQEINQTREKLNVNLPRPSSSSPTSSSKYSLPVHSRDNGKRNRQQDNPQMMSSSLSNKDYEIGDEIERYQKEEYQLKYLLKRLLQCMEDSQMTPSQITSCFLPSQHLKFNQGIISLQDAVEVFHVDLVQPLSKVDQSLLLMGYGTESNDIDIQTLLQDLGYWDPSFPKDPPLRMRGRDDDLDEELPPQYREPRQQQQQQQQQQQRARTPPGVRPNSEELSRTDLADIHNIVNSSLSPQRPLTNSKRVYDEVDQYEEVDKDEDILEQLRNEMEKEKEKIAISNKPPPEPQGSGTEENKETKPLQDNNKTNSGDKNNKTIEQLAAENVANALAVENAKLKAELSAFDREFFEELEDLKLNYSQLQHGKSLNVGSPVRHSASHRPLSPRTIGRLGKSARLSLKTMTRTKPLAGQYDMSHSYLGRLNSPSRHHKHPNFAWSNQLNLNSQSVLNPSKREFEPVDLRSSLHSSLNDPQGRDGHMNSFGNLCERRLQFELQNHSDPNRAMKTLLHEISSIAHSERGKGFILPKDLHSILTHLGLGMSLKEVEIFCTGFGSNGSGGIDALELGRVIQTMSYHENTENEIDGQAVYEEAIQGTLEGLAKDTLLNKQIGRELLPLREIAFQIQKRYQQNQQTENETQTENRKYPSKIYSQIVKIISHLFHRYDQKDVGLITVKEFMKVLKLMSVTISSEEMTLLSEYYQHKEEGEEEEDMEIPRNQNILYVDFIDDLSRVITHLLLSNDPLIRSQTGHSIQLLPELNPSGPWLLQEFDFIDELLNQLEAMKPSLQRKIIIQLQACLTQEGHQSYLGEGRGQGSVQGPGQGPGQGQGRVQGQGLGLGEEGYLDGYTVLKSLLSVGFNIPRDKRVKFLNNIEEYSGLFNFSDLIQLLSTSSLQWTSHERMVFGKILLSMGPTCSHRWEWLNRLKKDLQITSNEIKKTKKMTKYQKKTNLFQNQNELTEINERESDNFMISASLFLHCLRENGVNLEIHEEAILLDCLDFEIQTTSRLFTSRQYLGDPEETLSSPPEVCYLTFLTLCGHFVGKWFHSAPEINEKLKTILLAMTEPAIQTSLKELETLFRAFDENGSNTVEFRPFLVTCHRSRLLSSLESSVAEELGKLLIEDGEGRIRYPSFLIHLRALHHSIKRLKIQNKTIIDGMKVVEYEMSQQLLRNGSEHVTGTLKPLRDFLIQQQQRKSMTHLSSSSSYSPPLTSRDITELLNEFNIVYNTQDLDEFLETISSSVTIHDYFDETPTHSIHFCEPTSTSQLNELSPPNSTSLIHVLQQIRLPWHQRHPRLAKKIRKLLSRLSTDGISKLLTRLHAFSRVACLSKLDLQKKEEEEWGEAEGGRGRAGGGGHNSLDSPLHLTQLELQNSMIYVSGEIFQIILNRCGLSLDEQEIYFLCDESDAHVSPSLVRVSILLEALVENDDKDGTKRQLNEIHSVIESNGSSRSSQWKNATSRKYDDPSSGLFALEHLKGLIWTTGTKLKRRNVEWKSDVISLMNGFDRGGGVMRTEDFVLALSLLSIRLSEDILLAIPRISPSIDLIPYKHILEIIFDTSLEYDLTHHQIDRYGEVDSSSSPEERILSRSFKTSSRSDPFQTTNPSSSPSAVQSLIHLVRKSLNMFLRQQSDIEHAWSTLLAVFTKFDPNHENVISPRDFCLAVSVLMDGDSPVFTKQQWQEVIDHFRVQNPNSSVKINGVDYIQFLDAVLDSTVTKNKQTQHTPSWVSSNRSHPRDTLSSSLRRERTHNSLSPTRGTRRSVSPFKEQHQHHHQQPLSTTSTTQGIQSRYRASRGGLMDSTSQGVMERASRGVTHTTPNHKRAMKKTVTYGPSEMMNLKSNYFTELEEDYHNSSTISGRGVVGSSFSNKDRLNQLSKTAIPRTSSRYDELFGPTPSTLSRSLSNSIASTSDPSLTTSQLKYLSNFDTFTVKEFNSELFDCLTVKLGLSSSDSGANAGGGVGVGGGGGNDQIGSNGLTRKGLLLKYLDMEDKNHSGTLTKHSFLAGLNALGINHSFWSKPLQRELIQQLLETGNGMIAIADVMKLILFK